MARGDGGQLGEEGVGAVGVVGVVDYLGTVRDCAMTDLCVMRLLVSLLSWLAITSRIALHSSVEQGEGGLYVCTYHSVVWRQDSGNLSS